MDSVLISNVVIADSGEESPEGWVLVEGDRIAAIGHSAFNKTATEVLNGKGGALFPGFVDVHNHGAVGIDVNMADEDGLVAISKFLATKGVTAWVPTLVPDSDDTYSRIIRSIERAVTIQAEMPIAQIVGIHYEGVFANEKMCGALRPTFFKRYTGKELSDLPRLESGVHMMTLAPEIAGGIELVRELIKQGWIASIGHTKASADILDEAFTAGARHLTHFYNAMTGLHHRDVGVVGWAFTNKDVTFDIIADGVHVHPKPLEFACRTKGSDKVMLISDSVAPAGLGDGEFELWGERINVISGRTQNGRGNIAGSVITVYDAVKRMLDLGFSFSEVSQMASDNPAELLGLSDKRGSIEVGKRADLVLLDSYRKIRLVMINGRIAYSS